MAIKPPPGLMTQAEYARHRKVSRSYISRLAKHGVLVMRGPFVDAAASDAVLDDRPVAIEANEATPTPRQPVVEGAAGPQPSSYAQAKLADMVYRAKLRRLDYERRASKLLPTEDITVTWFTLCRQIRDKFLAMPTKLAPQLAAVTEIREVREMLETEIIAILRGLQDDIRYRRS